MSRDLVTDDLDDIDALAATIADSDRDPRDVPHAQVREWLLRLAAGDFVAPPPDPA